MKKKEQLLCKFGLYVFVTIRSVKLFSFETRSVYFFTQYKKRIHTQYIYARARARTR